MAMADITDPRYARAQNLWHLVNDYFYFTGSKAGEMVAKICLNSRSTAHFLTYADAEDVSRAVIKSQAFLHGVKVGIQSLCTDEREKDALCAVLTAMGDVLEGDNAAYEASRSYPAAISAIQDITPKDPAVWWSESSPDFLFVINQWIDDEVPILIQKQPDGSWGWSLSRERGEGVEPTKEAAMRAGEREMGWSKKPFKS